MPAINILLGVLVLSPLLLCALVAWRWRSWPRPLFPRSQWRRTARVRAVADRRARRRLGLAS